MLELSIVNYFFGLGGSLLIWIGLVVVGFFYHVKTYPYNGPYYEFIAMVLIGTVLGLALIFITIPTLCFMKSTLICYRVM